MILGAFIAGCGTQRLSVPTTQRDDKPAYPGYMSATYYYTEGLKASLAKNDPYEAFSFFEKAIEADPEHAPSYYQAAATLAQTEPARALEYALKATELDPERVWYLGQAAQLMVANGRYGEARNIYEELIVRSPKNPEYYGMLATLYQMEQNPEKALEVLEKAEVALGANQVLVSYKRDLLMTLGRTDEAFEQTESLIANHPYDYENYLALGEVYAAAGRDSLALANFNMARTLNPTGVDVLAAFNSYYYRKGDMLNYVSSATRLFESPDISLDVKVDFFREITSDRNLYRDYYSVIKDLAGIVYETYPGEIEAIALYAGVYFAVGDRDGGAQVYKDNLDLEPPVKEVFNQVIAVETFLERNDSIDKYTALALRKFPDDLQLYFQRASSLSYLKRYEEAIEAYTAALKYVSDDSTRSVLLGSQADLLYQTGKTRQSYRQYDEALRLWPDNTMVLNNYSYFLSEEGSQLEKALQMAQKVMESEPRNPTYIDTYGWVLYKLGRYDEARRALQQAVALDMDNSMELLIHYGDIFYALEDYYRAELYWRRALEAGYDEAEIEKRMKSIQER